MCYTKSMKKLLTTLAVLAALVFPGSALADLGGITLSVPGQGTLDYRIAASPALEQFTFNTQVPFNSGVVES
jgi:hypothetical protein